jgi:hypothetical protein
MSLLSSRGFVWSGVLIGLLLLGSAGSVRAQSNGDGSIYSRFGLGTLQDFSSSQSEALGGGAYALRTLNYNPMGNPALWSDQVFTRLSAGASFQRIAARDGSGPASRLSSGQIEAFQFSFPLYDRTLGVGLSFQPYTQRNFRTRRQGTLDLQVAPPDTANSGIAPVPYDVNFRGSGGLHSFRGGLGYRVAEVLRVGASVDVLFGVMESERGTEFGDVPIRDVTTTDRVRLVGVGGTVGAHLSLNSVFQSEDVFSVGGAVRLPTTLNGTRVLTLAEGSPLSPDTLSSVDGEVSLPWRSRFGVAYQPNAQWTFTADGRYEPWSTFTSTFGQDGVFSRSFPVGGTRTFTDRWRASVGAEVVPAGTDQLAGYFANVAYRLGAYTEQMYVRPDGETDLRTYAVTGGLSLPTSLPGTRIDVNLTAGTRGTTTGSLVRDTFYGVSLHVNFGERWFQERRLR